MKINKNRKKYMIFIISLIMSIQSIVGININAQNINDSNNISNTLLNDNKCEEKNINVITEKEISLLKFSSGVLVLEIGPYILGSIGKIIGKNVGKIIVLVVDSLVPIKIIPVCTSFGHILGVLASIGIGTYLVGSCLYKFINS